MYNYGWLALLYGGNQHNVYKEVFLQLKNKWKTIEWLGVFKHLGEVKLNCNKAKIGWKVSSVQFSLSVMSKYLQPHGLQHARLPYPSPTPRDFSNSCPLSWWCHSTIPSSVVPFSSCLPSFQQQDLFQWISSSHQVAEVLEFQPQYQSFQWILGLISFRIDWFYLL